MQARQAVYKESTISYRSFGTGPGIAICFHGYGEEAGTFDFFEKWAGDRFRFFAIDLPLHGKTEWKQGLHCSTEDLLEIIASILGDNHIARPSSDNKISLLGFSLGGRVALALCEKIPDAIERLVLFAPDGLKVNFWYWLATQTWLGNKFFLLTMKHPGWFFGFLKLLNKLSLVNASIFKFVNYYIGDKNVRQLLYDRWTTLRKIKPHLKAIKKQVNKNETPVRLIYGKHDRIILSSVGEKFRKGIESHCKLLVIHSGHQVLNEKHIAELLPALLDRD